MKNVVNKYNLPSKETYLDLLQLQPCAESGRGEAGLYDSLSCFLLDSNRGFKLKCHLYP